MLLIALLLGSLGAARARAPPLVEPPGFKLVFFDDFDGATLDTTKWTALDRYVQTPWDEVCYLASEVTTSNSLLTIRTRKLAEPVECVNGGAEKTLKSFGSASGFVDTVGKFSVRDGRIEINAQLPPPTHRIWPAGWVRCARKNAARPPVAPTATLTTLTPNLAPFTNSLYPNSIIAMRASAGRLQPRLVSRGRAGRRARVRPARGGPCTRRVQPLPPPPPNSRARARNADLYESAGGYDGGGGLGANALCGSYHWGALTRTTLTRPLRPQLRP